MLTRSPGKSQMRFSIGIHSSRMANKHGREIRLAHLSLRVM